MDNETRTFVEGLLNKYDATSQVDEYTLMFNNVHQFRLKCGKVVELDDKAIYNVVDELLAALDITAEAEEGL
jgi:hypothetical protein